MGGRRTYPSTFRATPATPGFDAAPALRQSSPLGHGAGPPHSCCKAPGGSGRSSLVPLQLKGPGGPQGYVHPRVPNRSSRAVARRAFPAAIFYCLYLVPRPYFGLDVPRSDVTSSTRTGASWVGPVRAALSGPQTLGARHCPASYVCSLLPKLF